MCVRACVLARSRVYVSPVDLRHVDMCLFDVLTLFHNHRMFHDLCLWASYVRRNFACFLTPVTSLSIRLTVSHPWRWYSSPAIQSAVNIFFIRHAVSSCAVQEQRSLIPRGGLSKGRKEYNVPGWKCPSGIQNQETFLSDAGQMLTDESIRNQMTRAKNYSLCILLQYVHETRRTTKWRLNEWSRSLHEFIHQLPCKQHSFRKTVSNLFLLYCRQAMATKQPSLQEFFFRFPNLFAICVDTFKYNQQMVCWEVRAGRGVLCSTPPW
jgi:hypothetical protein